MFCEKCGHQVLEGASFCDQCGYPVKGAVAASGGVTAPNRDAAPSNRDTTVPRGAAVFSDGGAVTPSGTTGPSDGYEPQSPYPPGWVGCLSFFPNAKKCVTSHYATFSGRATRGEFWRFTLFTSVISNIVIGVIYLLLAVLAFITKSQDVFIGSFFISAAIAIIISLALFIPSLAVTVRRLHDTNRSGWHMLWLLLPLIGPIVLLVFFLSSSDPEENKYGPLPDYTYYQG